MSAHYLRKGKGKEEYLYSAILVRTHTLKALRHGSHSFTCKLHNACLSFQSFVKAKFHYASWFEAGSKLVGDQLRTNQRN